MKFVSPQISTHDIEQLSIILNESFIVYLIITFDIVIYDINVLKRGQFLFIIK